MMFALSDMNKYCGKKLKLSRSENTKHIDYSLRLANSFIPLPMLIRVSRGKGEINNNNFAGIARALGLSEHELKDSVGCNLRRECVLLCLCVRLLHFMKTQIDYDPIVHKHGVISMIYSVETILSEIDPENIDELSKKEKILLSKRLKELTEFQGLKQFNSVSSVLSNKILQLI